jgi:hypothetical protein
MPELTFQVEGAESQRSAAEPTMLFRLRVAEKEGVPVQSVLLRCQVRIEPARRRYTGPEQERLLDLFGTPEHWGQTLRPLPWVQVSTMVPPFTGNTSVDLAVPCSGDFSQAATKYFAALEGGEIPLCFLFSGTIFYQSEDGGLQVTQIAWDREAYYRLSAARWHDLMDLYYPNSAWLCLRKDIFKQLVRYRSRQGLATWEQAIERLLAEAEEVVAS